VFREFKVQQGTQVLKEIQVHRAIRASKEMMVLLDRKVLQVHRESQDILDH
jgi:hypothetical protein